MFTAFPRSTGIYPESHKEQSLRRRVETAALPEELILALPEQVQPAVQPGQTLRAGDCIAQTPTGAKIPAPADGSVTAVVERPHPTRGTALSVVLETAQEQSGFSFEPMDPEKAEPAELMQRLCDAGVQGWDVLRDALTREQPVETVIINGVETRPWVACGYRLLLESAEGVVQGARILHRLFAQAAIVIALERSRSDVAGVMKRMVRDDAWARVAEMSSKYPQEHPRLLIPGVTGKYDGTALVLDVQQVLAAARAVTLGEPDTTVTVTVAGGAAELPRNLRVPVGMKLSDLARECGITFEDAALVIVGDTLTGQAQSAPEAPVLWDARAVLFLSQEEVPVPRDEVCIRCGRCAAVCPMGLMPNYLYQYARLGLKAECRKLGAEDCIDCRACGTVCPGGLPHWRSGFAAVEHETK